MIVETWRHFSTTAPTLITPFYLGEHLYTNIRHAILYVPGLHFPAIKNPCTAPLPSARFPLKLYSRSKYPCVLGLGSVDQNARLVSSYMLRIPMSTGSHVQSQQEPHEYSNIALKSSFLHYKSPIALRICSAVIRYALGICPALAPSGNISSAWFSRLEDGRLVDKIC